MRIVVKMLNNLSLLFYLVIRNTGLLRHQEVVVRRKNKRNEKPTDGAFVPDHRVGGTGVVIHNDRAKLWWQEPFPFPALLLLNLH